MPDDVSQGGPTITQLTELVRQADRLGLTWGRRPGTVAYTGGLFTPRQASVVMDGDNVGVTVVSLVGNLAPGDRIMVDRVPPEGLYAVALIDGSDTPMTAASTEDGDSVTTETVSLTIEGAYLRRNVVYEMHSGSRIRSFLDNPAMFAVRKGTTAFGTLWLSGPGFVGLTATTHANAQWVAYLTPLASMTTDVSLTVEGIDGPTIHTGSTLAPRFMSLRRVGTVDDYPQAVYVS